MKTKRRRAALTLCSLVLLVLFILFAAACGNKDDGASTSQTTTTETANTTDVLYRYMQPSYFSVFKDAKELVDKAPIVLVGQISDISFTVLDSSTAELPNDSSLEEHLMLYTFYDIEIVTIYKGEPQIPFQMKIYGGLEGYKTDEQLAAMQDLQNKTIPVLRDMPDLNIGETYLFVVDQIGSRAAYPYYPLQSIYNLSVESPLTQHPNMTAKDIILTFGEDKWQDFWAQWQAEHPDYQELTTTIYD
ncbi:MAG: hypothetical protein LBB67_07365 [Oscillospiraceae bacterium]|jgi:hypothetical protein|nr:hypothetical protein [Oscillospiraceae bacterium]